MNAGKACTVSDGGRVRLKHGRGSMTDETRTTTLPAFGLGTARPDGVGRNGRNTAGILPGEPNRLTHKVSKLSFGSAEA